MSHHLGEAFVRLARAILTQYPELPHSWAQNGDSEDLAFPASDPTGFDVIVSIRRNDLVIFARGAHTHFEQLEAEDSEDLAAEALGLARDLLSPDMRVREFRAAGSPYRWTMEICNPIGWTKNGSMGLLFWNYFGHRTQHVYQNQTLPGRLRQSVV